MRSEPFFAPPRIPAADLDQPVPLIPEPILRQYHCLEPTDTRFRSAARLLQALWREEQNLPLGRHRSPNGKSRKLGSRITPAAGRAGANFLLPAIGSLVRREVAYREIGAAIDTDRLYRNLLSSMPLAFNLFGLLKLDLDFATRVLALTIPGFKGKVVQVLFEHSPGRGHPSGTADFTAFDVLLRYRTPEGRRGFLAIEQKYAEAMAESAGKTRGRFDELSTMSGLFIDPDNPALRNNPFQQLWREHLLAFTMLDRGLYDEGSFVVIAPRLNWHAQNAVTAYARLLNSESGKGPGFLSITLERFIEALAAAGEPEFATSLHQRYCDFARIDGLVDAFIEAEGQVRPTRAEADQIEPAKAEPVAA